MLEFCNALQTPGESLQEWGLRLYTLAVHAFGRGMGARETNEVVSQFCTGLLDKQAGLQVANRLPESVPEAIRFVLRFQHSRDRIYGASSSQSPAVRLSRQQSPSPYREREQDPRASREIHFHDGIMFQHTADPGKRRPLFEAMTTKNIVIDSGNGIRGAVQSRGTSITEVPHPNHATDRCPNLVTIVSARDSLGRKNAPPQVLRRLYPS